ncbi:MAG TPA: rhodanese-like domain-containing protein [Mycobacteriales bacterium]|nr:rhodanese-like domain-containing protein [Mycobacteriales bacterium]
MDVPAINADELTSDMVLLDVREPVEWDAGHAVGAVHIPMHDVPARVNELPAGADLVIVCHIGGRSAQVTSWLNSHGITCRNLIGGMVAYAATGKPLASENGQPPRAE